MENQKDSIEIIRQLSEPLPVEAIQSAPASETHKGYDTVGYGAQWVINRLNEVLGINWGYDYEIIRETPGNFKVKEKQSVEITVELSLWIIEPKKDNTRKCVGGNTAINYSDAVKGSISNALKRAASMFGCGRQAYQSGDLDDGIPQKQNGQSSSTHGQGQGQSQNDPNICNLKKYQGVAWSEVAKKDPSYTDWCLQNSKSITPKEREIIIGLLKKSPPPTAESGQEQKPQKAPRENLLARGHILLKELTSLEMGYGDAWYRKMLKEDFKVESGAELSDEKLKELCQNLEQELADAKAVKANENTGI